MRMMSCENMLINYAHNKLVLATFFLPTECISRAGLEQEVKKLQKELAESTRDNLNLKEELSEASQIKIKLEELHEAEARKKLEAEKQLKFFQGSITAAFADRDKALTEAEIAKEKEELMSQMLCDCQMRLEQMKSDAVKAQDNVSRLQMDLAKEERENTLFKEVIDKFYQIRQRCSFDLENAALSYLDVCSHLLHDPEEKWSFNYHRETYAAQCKGLEIGIHLKRKVLELQNEKKMLDELIDGEIGRLRRFCFEQRNAITYLLGAGNFQLMSLVDALVQKFLPLSLNGKGLSYFQQNARMPGEDLELHVKIDSAIKSEVSALMSLQQQEERHLRERNETAALLEKLGELQRSFEQVTAEKMGALMKLEHLERELLLGKFPEKPLAIDRHRAVSSTMKEGRFKNLLRRTTSFKRFIGVADFDGPETSFHPVGRGSISFRRSSNNMDMSRMKIEISTLKENMQILEDLTSGIHKLRVSLVKIREACNYGGGDSSDDDLMRSIDHIISEANIVQASLCSPRPPCSSADQVHTASTDVTAEEREDSRRGKTKTVSAAGFEMVELLLLAAQTIKDKASETGH